MMFKYPLLPKNTWLYIATILAYSLTMILLQLFVTKETQIQWLSNHFNPIVFTISSYASMLAELPGIVLFGIIVLYKNRSTAFSFALGCTLTGIVVNMLKQLVFSSSVRPRLFAQSNHLDLPAMASPLMHYSFPSGHTAIAVCMGFCLCFLFPQKKTVFIITLLTIGVAFSRIFLFAHFAIDTAIGAMIGLTLAWMGLYLWPIREKL
jgi:membrane-associated phospholipid phosphatase